MRAEDYTAPEFRESALITIDTQRDVLDGGQVEILGTTAALPCMRLLTEAFRRSGQPIIHIVRLYQPDGSNVDLCRRQAVQEGARMLSVGSEGAQLASDLLPDPNIRLDADLLLSGGVQSLESDEAVIYKPRWGAFFRTPLEAHLRERGVSTLVFAGCNFPNCPRTSIYEASERDFRVVVARDAISGLYGRGEDELRGIGVRVIDSEEIVAALTPQSVGSGSEPGGRWRVARPPLSYGRVEECTMARATIQPGSASWAPARAAIFTINSKSLATSARMSRTSAVSARPTTHLKGVACPSRTPPSASWPILSSAATA